MFVELLVDSVGVEGFGSGSGPGIEFGVFSIGDIGCVTTDSMGMLELQQTSMRWLPLAYWTIGCTLGRLGRSRGCGTVGAIRVARDRQFSICLFHECSKHSVAWHGLGMLGLGWLGDK